MDLEKIEKWACTGWYRVRAAPCGTSVATDTLHYTTSYKNAGWRLLIWIGYIMT